MNPISRAYYQLTAYIPRKLPGNEAEYLKMKHVMVDAYAVTDEAQSWATIAGHITSTPTNQLRRPWGWLANTAKRLHVNALAQSHRQKAVEENNAKLEKLFKVEADRIAAEEKAKGEANEQKSEVQSKSDEKQAQLSLPVADEPPANSDG